MQQSLIKMSAILECIKGKGFRPRKEPEDGKESNMAITLKADPAQLRNAAQRMENQAATYQGLYKKLYQSIDTAYGAWKGGDSDAFYQKAQSLQDDFQRMYDLLKGAANDLRESADLYSQTQDNARSKASGLASSI